MTDFRTILNEMPITQNETELGAWVNRYKGDIRSALLDAYTGEIKGLIARLDKHQKQNDMPVEIYAWLSQVSNKSSTETVTITKSWSSENECDQTEFVSGKYIRADINAQLQEQCDSQLQTIEELKQRLDSLNSCKEN